LRGASRGKREKRGSSDCWEDPALRGVLGEEGEIEGGGNRKERRLFGKKAESSGGEVHLHGGLSYRRTWRPGKEKGEESQHESSR